ncbi:MAG TPA: hypothetical protein VMZ28_24255, partial [Kofleriaceae bacterium]|nr:hypothetical protein [Kofleriaceae bacterium]
MIRSPALLLLCLGGTAHAQLWQDDTADTIGVTGEWSNKVELADLNDDGRVDLLFANGGNYHEAAPPQPTRIFLNQGPGNAFTEATGLLGDTGS